MIVFQNKKKIVLHVPKTGGTFLKSILLNTEKENFHILKGNNSFQNNIIDNSHLTFTEAKKIGILTNIDSNYKIYSFVRNVKERLNSSIHECLRQNLLNTNTKGFYNDNELKSSLDIIINRIEKQFKNEWKNYEIALTHFKPQFLYVADSSKILDCEILKNDNLVLKFFKEDLEIEKLEKIDFKKAKNYRSVIPYSNNLISNIFLGKLGKINYLMFRFLNYKLKKKIDFSKLFKKQFDKLLLFYKEDEKIVKKIYG